MTFEFHNTFYFKLGFTIGKEWGPNRQTVGILIYLGFYRLYIWFGKNPWKMEPSPLTLEELDGAED